MSAVAQDGEQSVTAITSARLQNGRYSMDAKVAAVAHKLSVSMLCRIPERVIAPLSLKALRSIMRAKQHKVQSMQPGLSWSTPSYPKGTFQTFARTPDLMLVRFLPLVFWV